MTRTTTCLTAKRTTSRFDLPVDDYNSPDEDDVEIEEPDDDEINENNYRTTFAIVDDPDEDAESLSDYIADE